jgi:hypothetical protein
MRCHGTVRRIHSRTHGVRSTHDLASPGGGTHYRGARTGTNLCCSRAYRYMRTSAAASYDLDLLDAVVVSSCTGLGRRADEERTADISAGPMAHGKTACGCALRWRTTGVAACMIWGQTVACARVASMEKRYFAREGAEKPIRLGGSPPKILQTTWAIACTSSAAMREAAGST